MDSSEFVTGTVDGSQTTTTPSQSGYVTTTHRLVASFVLLCNVCASLSQSCIVAAVLKHCKWREHSALLLMLSMCLVEATFNVINIWGALQAALGVTHVSLTLQLVQGAFINLTWALFQFHMLAMAINRFVGVCVPGSFHSVWSYRNTKIAIGAAYVASFGLLGTRLFFCCPVVYFPDKLASGYYIPANATNEMFPFDIFCANVGTLIPACFYFLIFLKIAHQRWIMKQHGTTSALELKICWQFFLILTVHLIQNSLWLFLPLATTSIYGQYLISIVGLIDYSIDPIIYWIFNKTVRDAVKQLIKCNALVHPLSLNANTNTK